MICSERELGLSDEHEGIMVLDDSAVVGTRFVDVVPVMDQVLEIDNKSVNHRPDLWGHYGFARELAAIFDRPLRQPWNAVAWPESGKTVQIRIDDREACPRYIGLVIDGAKPMPSPDWLRYLLLAVGQRSRNVLVDLTNFVMLELGQPMHAFDLARLDDDGITVRRATAGEAMVTLDEEKRSFNDSDLLITSGGKPVALAGVMGGEESAVSGDTTTILLESANFRAATIRRTSSRLGLRTDSSARFEKKPRPGLGGDGGAAIRGATQPSCVPGRSQPVRCVIRRASSSRRR